MSSSDQMDEIPLTENLHSKTPPPLPKASLSPEREKLPAPAIKRSIPIRIIDSFRRDPNQHVNHKGDIIDLKLQHGHDDSYDVETAIANTAKSPLARKLEARHLQMLAIGGAIGMYF